MIAAAFGPGCAQPGQDALPEAAALADVDCPDLGLPIEIGQLGPPELDEASGLVASLAVPGLLWSHNDAGNDPVLFALTEEGTLVHAISITGVDAVDWEDIARGPSSAGDLLWLADIGDGDEVRASVELWSLPEPVDLPDQAAGSARVEVRYPDGPHDAEAFVVDPITGDGIIITKSEDGPAQVFAVAGPLTAGAVVAESVAVLPVPYAITAADVSADGTTIVVRSAGRALLWRRDPDQSIADTLAAPPCAIPLGLEPDGEAIALLGDGTRYITTSEGRGAAVFRVGPR